MTRSPCFDHFRSVYERFGSGIGKDAKIQRLLEYCVKQTRLILC